MSKITKPALTRLLEVLSEVLSAVLRWLKGGK